MKRSIEKELLLWKSSSQRMPLLIKGARQVGKSYIIEKFGRESFENIVIVNFEFRPEFSKSFQSLDPKEIVHNLEIQTNSTIIPGKTLLFLDEIQECPQAIKSLRYFKEQMANLHVIGAGSLLDFVLNDEKFVFPVGRVQFMYLRPLSFVEFLIASGNKTLLDLLEKTSLENPPNEIAHNQLLSLVKKYLFVGGMPAAVKAFLESDYSEYKNIQTSLITAYSTYFGKYTTKSQKNHLLQLFNQAPVLVGQHFQYSKADPETKSREIKVALEQLCSASLIHRIYATSASGVPLQAQIKKNKFKLLFLDTGLFQRANQMDKQILTETEITQINSGSLAEQFVGQELLAYGNFYEDKQLYFWEREKKHSSAEVDYITTVDSQIIPVEVKAGKTGRLKSLQQFMKDKKSPLGIRISQNPLCLEQRILSVPFYLISQITRLLRDK